MSNTTSTMKTTLKQRGKTKTIYKVKGKVEEFIIESIIFDGVPSFLVNDNSKVHCIRNSLELDEISIKPIEENACGYLPYKSTEEEWKELCKNLISTEEVLDEIYAMVDRYVSAPELTKYLITVDILLSYCQDFLHTIHFPFIVGDNESGKSAILHLAKWLCYRPLYGENIPYADVYNFLGTDEEATGTICEDEAQELGFDRRKLDLYKNSYAKGSLKPIIMNTDGENKHQVYYKTFCQKWFAGERVPENKGFKERLAIIHMILGEPKANIKRPTKKDEKQLCVLRNKLLVWKLQNATKGLPEIDSGLKLRDQELWEDFLAVTKGTKYYENCKAVVEHYTKQRHESIWNSLEAKLFRLVIGNLSDDLKISFQEFWNALTSGNVITGTIDRATFYTDDYGKITKNSLAKIFVEKYLATKMPSQYEEDGNIHQVTYYKFDKFVCETLAKKYNIQFTLNSPLIQSGQSSQGGQN